MKNTEEIGFTEHPLAALVLDEHSAEAVAEAMIKRGHQKQSFYIFNMDEAHRRIKHFRDMMPRVQIFYAMKSNDTSMLLKLAIALGLGFDCASPGEIYKLRKLNVPLSSIIYAMPTKTSEQMLYARQSGVKHTTFDTSYELKKLREYWPDARLLLRIRVESVSQIPLGEKFGCDYETEAVELLEKAASLGLRVIGIAFHVGCVCSRIESYVTGLKHARALFDHEARAGRKMKIVDIGGGYAGDRTDTIDQVSRMINKTIEELFPDPSVQIVAEPGRYVCDSAFTLYCSISNVRTVKRQDKIINMFYINDGVYGTLRFSENWHNITKFPKNSEIETNKLEETILWGPSCDSMDRVMERFTVRLPRCTPREWLVFHNHGAYTIAFSNRFSSLPIPLIRPVISMDLWEQVKDCEVFTASDFIIHPDISTPLPLTLPPPLNKTETYEHTHTIPPIYDMDEVAFIEHPLAALVLDEHSAEAVAEAMIKRGHQKQSFYIFNMDEAHRRIKHFRDMMPRVQIFYAMKSNDTSMLLKLAIALGLGFDCASPGEIYKLRKLNVPSSSIIYAMPTKSPEQMLYARQSGVEHTTFDTSYELKKLIEYWPDARLLLRIRVESVSQIPLGEKFGCDYETEAVELLEEAASLGLQVIGVAFHVGCICSSIESYVTGLRHARALFDHETRAGREMKIVDIGGGFPSDRTDRIDQVSRMINNTIEELFPDPSVQIVAEPGRYVSDSAFTLYCSISNVRTVTRKDKKVNMVYINDGVYGTTRYSEKWHKLTKFPTNSEIETNKLEETILWGPSCDSMDRVMERFTVRLPRCTPMDWLVFHNHGAYTIAFSTRFSSLPIPFIRPVISMDLWAHVKDCEVFTASDFIIHPDISTPLPLTLPPPLNKNGTYEHKHTPALRV